MKQLIIYHLHTTLSMLDSTTWFSEYVEEAKKRRLPAIAVTEHGNIFNWIKNMKMCKADPKKDNDYDMKYMMGVETYLTESLTNKVRDNYHTILIAKNKSGAMEICKLMTMAQDHNHKYYNPRISFDEFLSISDNVIKISACLGGPLSHLPEDNPYYSKLIEKYDFLEIQGHDIEDQKEYNKKLYRLARQYNKPLIFGTDTHELDDYRLECRKILLKAKRKSYGYEEKLNLKFITYDEAIEMCKNQNALPMEVYEEAIDNTVLMSNMVENFTMDTSFKYPDHLYEDPQKAFYDAIAKGIKHKISIGAIDKNDKDKYLEHVKEEYKILSEQGMQSFMVFMSELIEWCEDNGIPVGPGRGSVTGSSVAYLLGITDVNPVIWDTIFSRFCNSERISLADIDTDWAPSDRDKVYAYIQERFGEDRTSFIGTVGTLQTKGAIDEIARALDISISDTNVIKNAYCPLEEELKVLKKIKKPNAQELSNINRIKGDMKVIEDQWKDLFYYMDGIKGSAVSFGVHPAGIIASPINLSENIGLMYNNDKQCWVSQADMKTVDGLNYVKYDILGLKNVGIIKDACMMAGRKYPKAHEIDWYDEKVWEDLKRSPIGIFQYEGDYAFSLLKGFNAKTLFDMSLINASLRPSGASYREKVMEHIPNDSIPEDIFKLLESTLGYLVYQEQQIAFLQRFCGYSGGKADSIRRMVGKKDEVALTKAVPEIKEAYIKHSGKDRDVAAAEIEQFAQVFLDACDYSFGYNHSLSYSMIGYLCAYIRYYHPLEFIAAYLNNASSNNDIKDGTILADAYNVEIRNPKFGKSIDKYFISDGVIYKGIGSVSYLSSNVALKLKELADSYDCQPDPLKLFHDIMSLKIADTRQIMILIKIGFFSDFGKDLYLKKILDIYLDYYNRKTMSKTMAGDLGIEDIICQAIYDGEEGFEAKKKTYTLNGPKLTELMIKSLDPEEEYSQYSKICFEVNYLNYIQSNIDGYVARVLDITSYGSLKLEAIYGECGGYFINDSGSIFVKGDLIYISSTMSYETKKGNIRNKIMSAIKLDITIA